MPEGTTDKNTEMAAGMASAAASSAGTLTNTSAGTASEALLKAVAASEGSSPSSAPAAKAGDTTTSAAPAGDAAKPAGAGDPSKPSGQADSASATSQDPPALQQRFQNVARNARAKVYQDFGLDPRNTNPQDVKLGVELLADFRADPKSFALQILQELKSDEPGDEELPKLDLSTEEGYHKSLKHLLDVHAKNTINRMMQSGELKKVTSFVNSAERNALIARERGEVAKTVAGVMAEARQLKDWAKFEPEIEALIKSWPQETKRQLGIAGCVHRAYNMVAAKHSGETEAAIEQRVREANEKKARASLGSQHPTDSGGDRGKPPQLRNQQDLAAHMRRMAEAAG